MYAQGAFAVVAAAVLWSFDGLLRQGLYEMPSMLVVTLEHVIGGLLFLPFVARRWDSVRRMNRAQWTVLFLLCAVSGMLGLFLYTKALASVGFLPLSVVVLLQKSQPFFTLLSAAIVLRERLTARLVMTALIASVGGYFITFGWGIPTWAGDRATLIAALMAIGAAACWGSTTVLSKYVLHDLPVAVATGLRLMITALIAACFALGLGQYGAMLSLDAMQWGALVLIACSTGGVALGVYYWGLKRIPASHACMYELMWPVSAVAIDYVYRGIVLSVPQFLGAILLIGAVLSLPRKQA